MLEEGLAMRCTPVVPCIGPSFSLDDAIRCIEAGSTPSSTQEVSSRQLWAHGAESVQSSSICFALQKCSKTSAKPVLSSHIPDHGLWNLFFLSLCLAEPQKQVPLAFPLIPVVLCTKQQRTMPLKRLDSSLAG